MTRRCFIAIPPDDRTLRKIARFMRTVDLPNARLVDPANYHITLKFLGDVHDELIPDLQTRIVQVAASHPISDIDLTHVDYFPTPRRPRVFAACAICTPEVVALHQSMESTIADSGIPRDTRSFRPHLTLARFKHRPGTAYPKARDFEFPSLGFPMNCIQLIESKLQPTGPIYTPLTECSLGTSKSAIEDR